MKLKSIQLHQGVNFFLEKNGVQGFSGAQSSFNAETQKVEIDLPSLDSSVILLRFFDTMEKKKELLRTFVSVSITHSGIFYPASEEKIAGKK